MMTLLQCNITHILNKFALNQISAHINHVSLRNQACCIMQLLDSYSHTWRNVIQIGLKENVRLKRHIISMQNTQNEHNFKMQYQYTKIQNIL